MDAPERIDDGGIVVSEHGISGDQPAVDEREAAELFASYGATSFETFWRLRLPCSLPYVLSALKISTSLAVVGAIVGEFVGANQGLGYLVLVSSYHMETPAMFAAIVCAAAIGLVLFWAVGLVEARLVFWQKVDLQ